MNIFSATDNYNSDIIHGMLEGLCKYDIREAKLYFGKQIFWKCNIKLCQKKLNMYAGNWFVGNRISFVCALRFKI